MIAVSWHSRDTDHKARWLALIFCLLFTLTIVASCDTEEDLGSVASDQYERMHR